MNVWTWIVVVVLVVVVVSLLVVRRAAAGVDPTQLLLDPELVARVRALATANKKVAATTLLRDGTPGLSLAAARAMVERMAVAADQAGKRPTADVSFPAMTPGAAPGPISSVDLTPSTSAVPLDVELQARSLKSSGQPNLAVELVLRQTSWRFREAKEFVDRL